MNALPLGVDAKVLVKSYPRLYHLTHVDNWDLISRIGLRSATALMDLFGVTGAERLALESRNRRELAPIRSDQHGLAILRDQKPMDDAGLKRALTDGLTPEDWYRIVNAHVFFWVDRERVERLLGARAYRTQRHALLTVRTTDLLDRHSERVVLSPLNTGATKPMPHPRGKDCFVPMQAYPFAFWHKKRNLKNAVVELAVQGSVPDLMKALERVSIVGRKEPEEVIWPT
jgi:hypothetical protein